MVTPRLAIAEVGVSSARWQFVRSPLFKDALGLRCRSMAPADVGGIAVDLTPTRLFSLFVVVTVAVSSGGCSANGGVLAGDGGGGASNVNPSDPHAACNAYLSCASVVTPAVFPSLQEGYGTSGTCWASGSAATCEEACVTGLTQLIGQGGQGKPQCGCVADANCAGGGSVPCDKGSDCEPQADHCDVATGACVECLKDADCTGSLARCDTASDTCVECLSDSDCAASANGTHCLVSAGRCGPCATSTDCSSGEACFWQSSSTMIMASFACAACKGSTEGTVCGAYSTCTAQAGHPTCTLDPDQSTCLGALQCFNDNVPVDCVDDPSCCGGGMFPAAVCHQKCMIAHPYGGAPLGDCTAKCGACD